MILRAVLALAVLSASGAPARAAVSTAYDTKVSPLDDLARDLLTTNGYELRADGKVWDKISETPVAHTDMPYLLSRLASARRLKALLELNLILNRSEGEKKLTDEERESVRTIVRQNWPVFGVGTRRDFRSYFSVQELETLDAVAPRFDKTSALTSMKDPEPESVTAVPPVTPPPPVEPAAPVAAAPVTPAPEPPAAVAVAPAVVTPAVPTLTPMFAPPSLRRPSPFAAAQLPVEPKAEVPAAPAATVPAEVPPPPAPPAEIPPPPAPATPPVAPPPAAEPQVGVFQPWTPPAASTAAVAQTPVAVEASTPAVAAATEAPAAATPIPPPPAAVAITAEQYGKFVAEGPYTTEGRALLHLIGQKAPAFCLPLLRRTVLSVMPLIVLDGARTGAGLRAGVFVDPAKPDQPPTIALSPGAVHLEKRSGLFGSRQAVLLPEDPSFYAGLGIAAPALDALRKDAAPTATENGPWGATKVYADGSRRGSYSVQEQAGELLEQILRLGLEREDLAASTYAARRWTRTARLLFSQRLKDELGQDSFLDPDRRDQLRSWMERPEEADDAAVGSWAAARVGILDPRRGAPESALDFEARARGACVRTALEDALAEAARARARRVAILESLVELDLAEAKAAKAAAQSTLDEESATRKRLLAAPPSCPESDAARTESLRRSAMLATEAMRAERAMREQKASGGSHAD